MASSAQSCNRSIRGRPDPRPNPAGENRNGPALKTSGWWLILRNIVLEYGLKTGVSAEVNRWCAHSPCATAATNALSHEADIAKVQESIGHANVSTTRLYDLTQDAPGGQPDVQGLLITLITII